MALEYRLRSYVDALENMLELSDPGDSNFIRGYDNAVSNITHRLGQILDEECND